MTISIITRLSWYWQGLQWTPAYVKKVFQNKFIVDPLELPVMFKMDDKRFTKTNQFLISDFSIYQINLVPRVSLLFLHCHWEKTLVDSGHVALVDKHFPTRVVFSLYFDSANNARLFSVASDRFDHNFFPFTSNSMCVVHKYCRQTFCQWSSGHKINCVLIPFFAMSTRPTLPIHPLTHIWWTSQILGDRWPESTRVFSQRQWRQRRETLGTRLLPNQWIAIFARFDWLP